MFALVYYQDRSWSIIKRSAIIGKANVGKDVVVKLENKNYSAKLLKLSTKKGCTEAARYVTTDGVLSTSNKPVLNLQLVTPQGTQSAGERLEDIDDDDADDLDSVESTPDQSVTDEIPRSRSRKRYRSPASREDVLEVRRTMRELTGEVMELKESQDFRCLALENTCQTIVTTLKRVEQKVVEAIGNRSKQLLDYSILSEEKTKYLFSLAGGNLNKFSLYIEKNCYDQNDPELWQKVEKRFKSVNKMNFLEQAIIIYAGLQDHPSRHTILHDCIRTLNQKCYRRNQQGPPPPDSTSGTPLTRSPSYPSAAINHVSPTKVPSVKLEARV